MSTRRWPRAYSTPARCRFRSSRRGCAKPASRCAMQPEARSRLDWDDLGWEKQGGLLPVVVQDADTLQVLMLGYIDREALQATLDTGLVTFHSRRRQRLWQKGE